MSDRDVEEPELLRPLLSALEGKRVPRAELIHAGRKIAAALVGYGRPVSICGTGPWAGVWNLEHLTDDEAIAWGMWVATKVRRR